MSFVPLPRLVGPTAVPPLFATTKVASMKHSEKSIRPRWRKSSARVSSTRRNAPERHPVLEAPVAGLVGRKPLGQVLPARSAAQDPEHAVERRPVGLPGSAPAVGAPGQLGQQRLQQGPLGVGEFFGSGHRPDYRKLGFMRPLLIILILRQVSLGFLRRRAPG